MWFLSLLPSRRYMGFPLDLQIYTYLVQLLEDVHKEHGATQAIQLSFVVLKWQRET